jgi:hypothetical protein
MYGGQRMMIRSSYGHDFGVYDGRESRWAMMLQKRVTANTNPWWNREQSSKSFLYRRLVIDIEFRGDKLCHAYSVRLPNSHPWSEASSSAINSLDGLMDRKFTMVRFQSGTPKKLYVVFDDPAQDLIENSYDGAMTWKDEAYAISEAKRIADKAIDVLHTLGVSIRTPTYAKHFQPLPTTEAPCPT